MSLTRLKRSTSSSATDRTRACRLASESRLASASRSARRDRQRVSGSRSVSSRRSRRRIEPHPNPRQELLGHERLREVVVGACLVRCDAALEVRSPGHEEDRQVPPLRDGAHHADRVPARQPRQHRVEQHEIRPLLVEHLHQIGRIGRRSHGDPDATEHLRHGLGEVDVVVDHQHPHRLFGRQGEHLIDRRAERVPVDRLRQKQRRPRVRRRHPVIDVSAVPEERDRHPRVSRQRAQRLRERDGVRTERTVDERRVEAANRRRGQRLERLRVRDDGQQPLAP